MENTCLESSDFGSGCVLNRMNGNQWDGNVSFVFAKKFKAEIYDVNSI